MNYIAKFKIDNVFYEIKGKDQFELFEELNKIQNIENFIDMGYGFCVYDEVKKLNEFCELLNKYTDKSLMIEDIKNICYHLTIGDIECININIDG